MKLNFPKGFQNPLIMKIIGMKERMVFGTMNMMMNWKKVSFMKTPTPMIQLRLPLLLIIKKQLEKRRKPKNKKKLERQKKQRENVKRKLKRHKRKLQELLRKQARQLKKQQRQQRRLQRI